MLLLSFLWMFTIINEGQCGISLGTLMNSTSSCFGLGTDITNFSKEMTATCSDGHVISIESLTASAHPISDNCTKEIIATSNDTYQKCCQTTSAECTINDFHFNPLNTQMNPNQQCNGKQKCSLPVYNVDFNQYVQCNGADLPALRSHYMHINYYCIESSKIVKGCNDVMMSSNVPGSPVYLQSQNFPNSVSADSGCSCSIESDACDHGIDLVTIQRVFLPENNTSCKQNLRLNFKNGSIFMDWYCSDSSVEITQLSTPETYLNLTYANSLATTEGTFWLGFQSTSGANITINCPAKEKQLCLTSSTISSDISSTIDLSPTPTLTLNISMFDNSSIDISSSYLLSPTMNITTFSQMPSSVSETLGISSQKASITVTPTAVVTTGTSEQSSEQSQDEEWKIIVIIVLALLAALLMLVVLIVCCLMYNRTKELETIENAVIPEQLNKSTLTIPISCKNKYTATSVTKVTDTGTATERIDLTDTATSTEPVEETSPVSDVNPFTFEEEEDVVPPMPPNNTFLVGDSNVATENLHLTAKPTESVDTKLEPVSSACQTEMKEYSDKLCQTKEKRLRNKLKFDNNRVHPSENIKDILEASRSDSEPQIVPETDAGTHKAPDTASKDNLEQETSQEFENPINATHIESRDLILNTKYRPNNTEKVRLTSNSDQNETGNIPSKTRHKVIYRSLANGLFETEREDRRILRLLARAKSKHKSKTRKKKDQ